MSKARREPSLPLLPPRAAEGHKGDYGRALLIGGSRGMAGAIGLAGMATLRGGAGLVRLAVPHEILSTVAAYEPSYMTAPLAADDQGRIALGARKEILERAENATAVALGPGLGRSTDLDRLVRALYETLPMPLVCDADALNALATKPDLLVKHKGPRILTPHPGEFARLVGEKLEGAAREQRAIKLAAEAQVVVVLKSHRTLVTDGTQTARNTTGNPGMGTGGTGDVLTGLITALACQGLGPWQSARLGVHLHGLAGDLAAAKLGQVSLIARDLVDYLPRAFQHLK
jgi:NAD(P)H-hydrate epimerase